MFNTSQNQMTNWRASNGNIEYFDTSRIEKKYQDVFKYLFPEINLAPQTPQGQIITALTQQDVSDLNLIAEIVNSFFYGGNGLWLDYWAYTFFGKMRKQETIGYVYMTIEGKPKTEIKKGFEVSNGDLNFKLAYDVTLANDGKTNATFDCDKMTQEIAPAMSVTRMVSKVEGVERVYNRDMSRPAVYGETDDELRMRCLDSFGARQDAREAILNSVLDVKGVQKATIIENTEKTPLTSEGVTMPPNSFGIIVSGGNFVNTDLGREVATAIDGVRPLAAFMPDDGPRVVSYTVPNRSGGLKQDEFKTKISYIIANTFQGKVKMQINRLDYYDGLRDKLIDLVQGEVKKLGIGQDLFSSNLILAIENSLQIPVRSLSVAPKDSNNFSTSIANNWSAVLFVDVTDIDIEVV